jgi:hypothetical protein
MFYFFLTICHAITYPFPMSEEPTRTGANPAEPDTPTAPAAAAPFDLPAFFEQQLAEGLTLIRHASSIAADERNNYPRDRNGAIGNASRVMLANVRSAETLTRFNRDKEKERIYREVSEMTRTKAEEAHLRLNLTPEQRAQIDARPPVEEFRRRRAAEHKRVAESRPVDANTAWLDWYWEQYPAWNDIDRAIANQSG